MTRDQEIDADLQRSADEMNATPDLLPPTVAGGPRRPTPWAPGEQQHETHFAVIETMHEEYGRDLTVVAAGPPDYCRRMLDNRVRQMAPLAPNETALILAVISRG